MNFYILRVKTTSNSWDENEMQRVLGDNRKGYRFSHDYCPVCHRVLGGWPEPPIRCELHIAAQYFGDIVPSCGDIFFSKQARDLFLESGLRGIQRFEHVEILKLKTHNGIRKSKLPPLPEYYFAYVNFDGAIMDYKHSKAILCPPILPVCEYCISSPPLDREGILQHTLSTYTPDNKLDLLLESSEQKLFPNSLDKYTGIYVDESRWNGNNIFRLIGIGGTTVVDQTFVDWANENNLTGCHFAPESEPSADWGQYVYYEKRFGPGLHYDLE